MPRARPHHRHLLRWLILSIGCIAAPAAIAAVSPTLQGQWEVVQVAVDHRDQPHWLYFPDDPRLLGRLLSIDDAGVRLDDDSRPCAGPVFTALHAGTLQHFIGERYPRPAAFDTPIHPTLADFGIGLADASVTPLQLGCTSGGSPWNGAWFVVATSGRLLTNFDNGGYVLVLRRRGEHEPIRASFACAKARGAAEQAICASASLAGYDRSVAAAYRFALRRAGDDAGTIRQAQRSWLDSRNACGADTGCLVRSMRERVDQLMQQ